jgi:hypothetical protein
MTPFIHRKRVSAAFFFVLLMMMSINGLAQTRHADSVIITDLEYSAIWQQMIKRLEGFPIAEANYSDGLIKSEQIRFNLSGILGLTYSEETQEFRIQLTSHKPGITAITVTVKASRTLRSGTREDLADTSHYEVILLDHLIGRNKMVPSSFR